MTRNFFRCRICAIIYVLLFWTACLPAGAQEAYHFKKIIQYGWDVPTAEFIQKNIREMETRPFDGIIFRIGKANKTAFDFIAWDESQMEFDTLAQIRWDRFTDNFLLLWAFNKYRMVDWFDDSHWETITANLRLYARAAKTAGCIGICFDPEDYGTSTWIYNESFFPDKTFDEAEAMVRQRGGQFIEAIQEEFPDVRLLCFFLMLNLILHTLTGDNPPC